MIKKICFTGRIKFTVGMPEVSCYRIGKEPVGLVTLKEFSHGRHILKSLA